VSIHHQPQECYTGSLERRRDRRPAQNPDEEEHDAGRDEPDHRASGQRLAGDGVQGVGTANGPAGGGGNEPRGRSSANKNSRRHMPIMTGVAPPFESRKESEAAAILGVSERTVYRVWAAHWQAAIGA
jgi:hypothetical protein